MIRLKYLAVLIMVLTIPACEAVVDNTILDKSADEKSPAPERTFQEQLVLEVGDRIFFDEGMGDIPPEQSESGAYTREILPKLAGWMAKHRNVRLVLEGHAEDPGTRKDNLMLAATRAISALDFLVALGVDCERLQAVSYGYERPAVIAASWTGAAGQNRRVVFVVKLDNRLSPPLLLKFRRV